MASQEGVPVIDDDPWSKKFILALEGGGTRGYASLLMLQKLMTKIKSIETSKSPPDGYNGPTWEAHSSSFGPPFHPSLQGNHTIEPRSSQVTKQSTFRSLFRDGRKISKLEPGVKKNSRNTNGIFLPCHYFDYIGGTSTGGLAAIMLGRLRMSPNECIERYPQLAQDIFSNKQKLNVKGIIRDKYNHELLAKAIRAIVDEHVREGADEEDKKLCYPEDLCRTVVVSRERIETGQPYIFRSYDHWDGGRTRPLNPGPAHDCQIWEVGRATSAAPSYFKSMPIQISSGVDDNNTRTVEFIDGGAGCNDPTHELYREARAKEILMGSEDNHPVRFVLTLGTGKKSTLKENTKRLLVPRMHIIRTLKNIVGTAVPAERLMADIVADANGQVTHHKWNGGSRVSNLGLDKWKPKDLEKMVRWVDDYMNTDNLQRQLQETACFLVVLRRERNRRNQDRWHRFAYCTEVQCPLATQCRQKPFKTKEQAMAHIKSDHQDDLIDPQRNLEDPNLLKWPWMRGPL